MYKTIYIKDIKVIVHNKIYDLIVEYCKIYNIEYFLPIFHDKPINKEFLIRLGDVKFTVKFTDLETTMNDVLFYIEKLYYQESILVDYKNE